MRYAEFSLALHRTGLARRVPLHGTIELTRRCSLDCVHCYNRVDPSAAAGELSLEEFRRILDEIVDAGCLWLLLTGGEIFMRPDFPAVYEHARRKGLLITLFTNGTLIGASQADLLREYRPFSIEVTMYGATQSTYERVTRVPGSFERCLEGIGLLRERRLPLTVKMLVTTLNRHELGDVRRRASLDWGCRFRYDAMLNPRLDRSCAPLEFRLGPEAVAQLDANDPERRAAWKKQAAVPRRAGGLAGTELYVCAAGLSAFHIDPYGRLRMCGLLGGEGHDLRAGTFLEGWRGCLLAERKRQRRRDSACGGCDVAAYCETCPALAELECGDAEKPIDFACRVARARARGLRRAEALPDSSVRRAQQAGAAAVPRR